MNTNINDANKNAEIGSHDRSPLRVLVVPSRESKLVPFAKALVDLTPSLSDIESLKPILPLLARLTPDAIELLEQMVNANFLRSYFSCDLRNVRAVVVVTDSYAYEIFDTLSIHQEHFKTILVRNKSIEYVLKGERRIANVPSARSSARFFKGLKKSFHDSLLAIDPSIIVIPASEVSDGMMDKVSLLPGESLFLCVETHDGMGDADLARSVAHSVKNHRVFVSMVTKITDV